MPNVLDATYFKRRPVRGLRSVTVRQKFSSHTVTTLDYEISDHRQYLLPPENTPVTIRFGKSPLGIAQQYAYVNHYESVTDADDTAMTRVVTVGTSKQMNAVDPASWQGQTRSSMARDIAAKHRLRSVVHTHPYVLDNWATGTRSDFQALKALADEAGYRLWVDGATLWFLDPTKLVRTASSMSTPVVRSSTIRSLEILGGSNIPGELTATKRRVQYGLDYRSNEFFQASSGDPTMPTEVGSGPVSTFSEAQYVADAAERKERDYYVLKTTFDGNARIYPGTLIRVDSGRVTTDQGGLWLVTEATHEVSQTDFSTRVVATKTNQAETPAQTPTTTRAADNSAQAVVRDSLVWEAALQEQVYV